MARSSAMTRQIVRDFGTCLSFDGTSAKVIVTSNATIQGMANLTLSFWFKAKDVGGANRKLFFKNGVYDIGLDSSGQLFAEVTGVNNFGIFSSRNMGDNTWHHFVITYDGSTAAAYLDGVSIASTPVVGAPSVASNANNLGFGQHVANANEWYLGLLDDVRIYNTGLTSAQVTAFFYGVNPSSTPVAWWKFDEGSGTTANDSIGSSTGTITAATYSTDVFMKLRNAATGRFVNTLGTAASFKGGKAQVADPSPLNITNPAITVECWAYAKNFPNTQQTLVRKDGQFILRVNQTSNKANFYIFAPAFSTAADAVIFPIGKWNHVAGTYDGANIKVYVNGVLAGTTAKTGNIATTANPFTIGNSSDSAEPFNGFIDEVRVSNIVRYTGAFTPQTTPFTVDANTIFLAHMDEGSGTTIADSSGNNINLTMSGTTTGWTDGIIPKTGLINRAAA